MERMLVIHGNNVVKTLIMAVTEVKIGLINLKVKAVRVPVVVVAPVVTVGVFDKHQFSLYITYAQVVYFLVNKSCIYLLKHSFYAGYISLFTDFEVIGDVSHR